MSRWPVSVRRARDRLYRRKWAARAFDELIDRYRGDRCSRSWFMLCWSSSFDSPAWKNNSGSLIFSCYAFIWLILIELPKPNYCMYILSMYANRPNNFLRYNSQTFNWRKSTTINRSSFFSCIYWINEIPIVECWSWLNFLRPFLFIYVNYVDNFTPIDVTFALRSTKI